VRLRTLTEAECYARCYGGRREETVSVLRFGFEDDDSAERASDAFAGPAGSGQAGSGPAKAREAA
jgi:hypothetical protein